MVRRERLYGLDRLRRIYDKTEGYCYHCGKKIAWKNYGEHEGRGAWEVDHSKPRASGGTDHLNNLFPSCPKCNRSKGTLTSRQFARL